MTTSIARQVVELQNMSVIELRQKWMEVFGEETKQRHRIYLWKRLARKLQEEQLPKLSPEEENRVAEYRKQIRKMPPEKWFPGKQHGQIKPAKTILQLRTPPPGSVITRDYKGQEIMVTVLDSGFEYCGQVFRSLSAVAKEITGTTWNGYTFFHLKKEGQK